MKKREFLDALRQTLSLLPSQELEKQLTYYDEMLTDMIEDGMSEEEATARIGDPVDIGLGILADMPNPPPASRLMEPPQKVSTAKTSFWFVVALILGIPIWVPLAAAVIAVFVAVIATVIAVIIAVGALVVALIVGGIALILAAFFTTAGSLPLVLLLIGFGFLSIGLGVLSVFVLCWMVKGLKKLFRAIGEANRKRRAEKEGA